MIIPDIVGDIKFGPVSIKIFLLVNLVIILSACSNTARQSDATLDEIQTSVSTPIATATFTPAQTATLMPTPMSTDQNPSTATPDLALTQTAEASNTITPDFPITRVPLRPHDEFEEVYARFQNQLGKPLFQAIEGQFAEQPFENGYMIWSAIGDRYFIMIGDKQGSWLLVTREEVGLYAPEISENLSCEVGSPPKTDLYQPIYGFGVVWCNREDIRQQIGWATKEEFSVVDNRVQPFENGFLVGDSRNFIYVLISNENAYIRVEN